MLHFAFVNTKLIVQRNIRNFEELIFVSVSLIFMAEAGK